MTDELTAEEIGIALESPENLEPKKLKQTVELKDIGPCKKHIKVTVERADIDERLNEKYSELVKGAAIPGFRPGKAPRQVVTKRFEKDVVSEVKGQVLLASLEQLAEDFDVAPLSPPELDPSKIEIPKEGDFMYEFDVEVRPEFDLPNYRGMKIKRPTHTFTDSEVEHEQKRLLSRWGTMVPKEDGIAELGDFVIADMTSRFSNVVIGTAKEVSLRVDQKLAFRDGISENFGAKVIGAKMGDTRVVDITMGDAVAMEQLRGQTLQATLEIKDVKTLRLPELDESFLDMLGVKTADQLKEQVRVLLERRLEYEQRQSARTQVLEQITAASQWELPRDLLVRQARKTLARKVMEMREAGMAEDEIRGRERVLQRDVIASTTMALKEHFVLQKIAELEKIDVDEDDINNEIERLADQTEESPRRVRARMEKEDLLETLAAQLIERKALDLILDSAEYEDVSQEAPDAPAGAVEQQVAPGEMKDPTAAPAEAKAEEAEASPTA